MILYQKSKSFLGVVFLLERIKSVKNNLPSGHCKEENSMSSKKDL